MSTPAQHLPAIFDEGRKRKLKTIIHCNSSRIPGVSIVKRKDDNSNVKKGDILQTVSFRGVEARQNDVVVSGSVWKCFGIIYVMEVTR